MANLTFLPRAILGLSIFSITSATALPAVVIDISTPDTAPVESFPFFADAIVSQEPLPGVALFPSFTADFSQSGSLIFTMQAPAGEFFQWLPDSNPNSGMLVALDFAYGTDPDLPRLTAANTTLSFDNLVSDGPAPFIPSLQTEFAEDGSFFEVLQCQNCFEESGSATFTGLTLTIDYSNLSEAAGWSEMTYDPSSDNVLWFVTFNVEDESSDRSLAVIPEPSAIWMVLVAGGWLFRRRR